LKLLFDQNLSRKLPGKLASLYPGSTHVLSEGLDRSSDFEVRRFAAQNDFIIVSRDRDFAEMDTLLGPPPKIIWIARENAPTAEYERLLCALLEQIEAFSADSERSLLVIT
jgi:predicted nuclease of predicted toxin-antitoxin system